MELRKRALKLLAEAPEGITFKRVSIETLGHDRGGAFFMSWRGSSAPLRVGLTVHQIEKLGLDVKGLDAYSDETLSGRIPIYFHPKQRKLWRTLKQYEGKTVFQTPKPIGVHVEEDISELTKESRRNISETLKREFGEVYVIIRCPKCKHEIHLKAV